MLEHLPPISLEKLSELLTVGDCVFIRIPFKPFRLVAAATGSWTNHVGVVIECGASGPVIAESKFPFSRKSSLRGFLGRSEGGRVAVSRLNRAISGEQRGRLEAAATRRLGTFYDTGFDLRRAHRQFCSRYVREVLAEATGISVGEVESFATLLSRRPNTDLGFWRMWYFGRIPWSRETVSPASLLESPHLAPVFDGFAAAADTAS
jgi:hypothetical protein